VWRYPTISLQIHFNNSQIYSVLGEAFEPPCEINVMTRNQNDVERKRVTTDVSN